MIDPLKPVDTLYQRIPPTTDAEKIAAFKKLLQEHCHKINNLLANIVVRAHQTGDLDFVEEAIMQISELIREMVDASLQL